MYLINKAEAFTDTLFGILIPFEVVLFPCLQQSPPKHALTSHTLKKEVTVIFKAVHCFIILKVCSDIECRWSRGVVVVGGGGVKPPT